MVLLVAGVLLFATVHFVPSRAPALKSACIERTGENGYKGIFSLLLLAALAMIIWGWRQSPAVYVYTPIAGARMLTVPLMTVALFLFIVSNRPSKLRGLIRHPQLLGVALWGLTHLMVNGDNRSLVLFGGMTLWSFLEIVAINRRDGAWVKPEAPGWSADLVNLAATVVVVAILMAVHPWIAGVGVW